MPLARLHAAFDHPDWIFELKYDGWRALAYIGGGRCRLVSRKGNTLKSFPELCASLGAAIQGPAVLDGEIVALDAAGKPQFYELMRRKPACFAAFDLLSADGRDLRRRPLLERKAALRRLIRRPVLFQSMSE
jgi:bifunctional non-homologous end joining protein LigD